ncbi:MAG: hypothetical protein KDA62_16270, partial [Planctomycetales bacterium]|nr:hypothetical protein [Planctomycetales bacterium]
MRRVVQLQSSLDPLDPRGQPVDGDLLPGSGFVAVGDFPFHQHHARLKAAHSQLQVGHIVGNLIDTGADMAQVFEYQILSVGGHAVGSDSLRRYLAIHASISAGVTRHPA